MAGAEHNWSRERTEGEKGASGNSWGKAGKRDRKGSQLCSIEGQGKPGSDGSKMQWSRKCQGRTEAEGDPSKQCLLPGGASSMQIQVNG